MRKNLDEKVLAIITRDGVGRGGVDEWIIASSIYPWDKYRSKHGAWIRAIIQAGERLQKRGLVGCFMVSHGEGTSDTRIWFSKGETGHPLPPDP